jgi:glycogen(starch) synthase
MRIIVAGLYGGENGIETYTRHLASALGAVGHDVLVVDRTVDGAKPIDGVTTVRVRGRSWVLRDLVGPFETVRVHGELRRLAREWRADLLHATYPEFVAAQTVPAVATAWFPDVDPLARLRSAGARGEARRQALHFALSDRLSFRRAAHVVSLTPAATAAVASLARTTRIPAFVPDHAVEPPPAAREPVVVMVARNLDFARKGLDLAVAAVAIARRRIPGLRLRLVGGWDDDRARAALPDFCDAVGVVDAAAVRRELRAAGCAILPSTHEEVGYAGLEALAAGTPLVSAPLPAFAGAAVDGLVLVEERTPEAFAAAIERALGAGDVRFPDEWRASSAVAAIDRVYRKVVAA